MDINWNKAEDIVSEWSDFTNGLISPRYQNGPDCNKNASTRRRAFSFAAPEKAWETKRHPSLKDTCWIC